MKTTRILGGVLCLLFILGASTIEPSDGEKEILVVDRFSEGLNEEGIPKGWTREKEAGSESKIFVERETEGFFLHLLSIKDSFGVEKKISFDIRTYPYLSWRWRALKLPQGGDIRKRETDDQAGQVYVLFPRFPALVNTRSMGYIWDTLAPAGATGGSTAYSKMKYVVLQSGPSKLNQWIWETRNVYEDYRKYFQEEPPPVGAVLLYINSQHTQSSAEIHYGEIFFSAQPPKELNSAPVRKTSP